MTQGSIHQAVMLSEVVAQLKADSSGIFLDCTLGGAGHTAAILDGNSENTVYACDRDLRVIERASTLEKKYKGRLVLSHSAFSQLSSKFTGFKFNGILADLGLSSDQLQEQRGFSFNDRGALDMRMNEQQALTADQVVNSYEYSQLYRVLKSGGVGKFGKAITAAIIRARPIGSTSELTNCIHRVCGARDQASNNKDSATVVFQAIRMEVNQELSELEALLNFVEQALAPTARFVVISFHSIEDTVVTRRLRNWSRSREFSALCPVSQQDISFNNGRTNLGRLLTKKALLPSAHEISLNPRARSAKMRVFEMQQQAAEL